MMRKRVIAVIVGILAVCAAVYGGGVVTDDDFIPTDAGKIILQDGTVVTADEFDYGYDADNPPVAVVAFERDGKLYGIGLHIENKLEWALKKTNGVNLKFSSLVCMPRTRRTCFPPESNSYTGCIEGSNSWAEICAADPEGSKYAGNYPVFSYAENYGKTHNYPDELGSGWYVPSIAELTNVVRNIYAINVGFKKINKIASSLSIEKLPVAHCYWSSSQDANDNNDVWINVARSGFLNNATKKSLKAKDLYVFVLRAFDKPE